MTASEHGDALREFSRRLNRQATELVEAQEFAVMSSELSGVSARESLWIASGWLVRPLAADYCLRALSLVLGRSAAARLQRLFAQPWVAFARQGLGGGTSGGGVAS